MVSSLETFRSDALGLWLSEPSSYDGVFQLADEHGLTVYDAAYLDLAVHEAIPLASLDGQLIRAAKGVGIPLFQP